ncbi:hypothetical protein QZH41_014648 [Actinostola sp. cb2023]|nr:hypothetical protein QZH41_014648 [Actinostola sp. cb2023]
MRKESASEDTCWYCSHPLRETIKVRTYVHIFDSCSQDWFAVASILENVASELTRTAPQLKEIYLRSDNAGCYHNASLLVSAPVIISKKGLTLRDYSFSEANSGKDVCDRKIAPLKAHIERYLNEEELINQYADVFDRDLGTLPGKVQLEVDQGAIPVTTPPRRVPIALKDTLKR